MIKGDHMNHKESADFISWLENYALQMWGNKYLFYDGSRQSGLTPHGEDLAAAYNAGTKKLIDTNKELLAALESIACASIYGLYDKAAEDGTAVHETMEKIAAAAIKKAKEVFNNAE
jgi:hypothetical protein